MSKRRRIYIAPRYADDPFVRAAAEHFHPGAEIFPPKRRPARFATELTPIGEQYVVPGCEKHVRQAGAQLKLFEG